MPPGPQFETKLSTRFTKPTPDVRACRSMERLPGRSGGTTSSYQVRHECGAPSCRGPRSAGNRARTVGGRRGEQEWTSQTTGPFSHCPVFPDWSPSPRPLESRMVQRPRGTHSATRRRRQRGHGPGNIRPPCCRPICTGARLHCSLLCGSTGPRGKKIWGHHKEDPGRTRPDFDCQLEALAACVLCQLGLRPLAVEGALCQCGVLLLEHISLASREQTGSRGACRSRMIVSGRTHCYAVVC
mmetsp:Transcript_27664/g.54267  ORF Transcript_27664/g.54267 Transcript_27664/m.54267 type:complete len:241 (-) Transcript_27664:244-966(-)